VPIVLQGKRASNGYETIGLLQLLMKAGMKLRRSTLSYPDVMLVSRDVSVDVTKSVLRWSLRQNSYSMELKHLSQQFKPTD
jgi:hypothetical protein